MTSNAECIIGPQGYGPLGAYSVDAHAVGAADIIYDKLAVFVANLRMKARDLGIVHDHLVREVAPDTHCLPLQADRLSARWPYQGQPRGRNRAGLLARADLLVQFRRLVRADSASRVERACIVHATSRRDGLRIEQ